MSNNRIGFRELPSTNSFTNNLVQTKMQKLEISKEQTVTTFSVAAALASESDQLVRIRYRKGDRIAKQPSPPQLTNKPVLQGSEISSRPTQIFGS
jgi:hypothetical protein